MPDRKSAKHAADKQQRYRNAKAPTIGPEEIADLPENTLCIIRQRGLCRVQTGFTIKTASIPAEYERTEHAHANLDERRAASLAHDLRTCLRPLMQSLPIDAGLLVEYHFNGAGMPAPGIDIQIMVETAALDELHARQQAQVLSQELEIALRALSAWYAFAPRLFSEATAHYTHVTLIRPRTRALSSKVNALGFRGKIQASPPILFVAATAHPQSGYSLAYRRRESLTSTIAAAQAYAMPSLFTARIRRQAQITHPSQALIDGATQCWHEGDAAPKVLDELSAKAARAWLDMLDTQPECFSIDLKIHSISRVPATLARLFGAEIFPSVPIELIALPSTEHWKSALDTSTRLAPAEDLPPLLPDPEHLLRLGFSKHLQNVAITLPHTGLVLGTMEIGGMQQTVKLAHADRSRHVYLLGATGTGKSTLLYNMIRQDIQAGFGLAMMDPHGDLFDLLIANMPEERIKDVWLIDPSDPDCGFCLNPFDLGNDPSDSQINRAINDLIDIFSQLFDMRSAGGPAFEQYFRNTCLLALYGVYEGEKRATLETVIRILREKSFRQECLRTCKNEAVIGFFHSAVETSGDQSFANYVPYISSKLTRFFDNPLLRKILLGPKTSINLRYAMDQRQIILVNLAKGAIGGQDARLLGMLLTNKLFADALARADLARNKRTPFYLYLDEFQNFTTVAIADSLSEARKYGLYLTLAHQTLGQLINHNLAYPGLMRDAVLGNAATKLLMRVGLEDAEMLSAQVRPYFSTRTLAELPDRQVLGRLLVNNRPSPPFVFSTWAADDFVSPAQAEKTTVRIQRASRARHAVLSETAFN